MTGFPPKPTALKILEGNPGKRALPANEPKYPPGVPVPPRHMSAGARVVWDDLVTKMAGAGVLRRVDRLALWQLAEDEALIAEAYSGIWKMKRALAAEAKASGKTLPAGAFFALIGMKQGRLAMAAIRDLAGRVIIERREFGLTPSSRSRIEAAPDSAGIDALEQKLCG